jgi:hypothetical protein
MTHCLALLALTLAADTEPAPKKLTDAEKAAAEKAVKAHLEKMKADAGALAGLNDAATGKALPGLALFTVVFPQFPVARTPPEGLKAANVLAVDARGKVTLVTSAKDLEKLLSGHLPAASSEAARKDAARAAARIGQELHNDGFYRFTLEDGSVKAEGKSASARSVVSDGGKGSYQVTLTFDEAGKVTKLEEKADLTPGMRPRCQATKLLDADPIVRALAEDSIRTMGRAASPYLADQYGKASGDLKRAIGHAWRRVMSEGR